MAFFERFRKNVKNFAMRNHVAGKPAQSEHPQGFAFFLSLLNTALGYGPIWRVPFLAYTTNPGAFVIIYGVSLLTLANSINFMEVFLGQYSSQTAATVYKLVPSAAGIGIASILYGLFYTSVNVQIISYAGFYLLESFAYPLPWTGCLDSIISHGNGTKCEIPSLYFWFHRVIQVSGTPRNGLDEILPNLFVISLLTWLVVFLTAVKAPKKNFLPIIVLLAILGAVSVFTKNAENAVRTLFTVKFSHFLDPNVWERAIEQSFYSLGIGMTATITKSRYAKYEVMTHIDCTIVSFTILFLSLFFSIAFFSAISLITHELPTDFVENGPKGVGLLFVTYSETLRISSKSPLLSITFFLCFIFIGINVVSDVVESISVCFKELFPKISTNVVKFCVCFAGFLIGCVVMTRGGHVYFEFLDRFALGYPLMFITIFELLFVSFGYGLKRFCQDIAFMTGYYPNCLFRVSWFTGGFFLALIVSWEIVLSSIPSHWIGWNALSGHFLTTLIISPIFSVFIYKAVIFYQNDRFYEVIKADPIFGPHDANLKVMRKNFRK